jgi:hypothetical protein
MPASARASASTRPDEGPALLVFLIARLFADQHDARVRRPFAGHDLRRVLVERAAAAFRFGGAQRFQ